MKKNLFMLAAVALMSFTACNKEEVSVENPVDNQTPATVVEFTASFATTKTALDNTGAKTLWVESDRIDINGQEFKIKELIDGGLSAKFENVNDLPGDFAAPFTATYPYGVTEVPAAQTAKADTSDPAAVLETAESDDYTLSFKNVTSLLKFQVATACETVTITSSDALAGSSAKTVTVTGPFVTGKTYYAAVLPGKKADFVVRMDGYLSKNAASVTVGESTIANMGTLPAPVKSDWAVVGSDVELGKWVYNDSKYFFYNEGELLVAKNVPFTAETKFKVVCGSGWYALTSVVYNLWGSMTTSSGDMQLNAGKYDIYLYESKQKLYITTANSLVPEKPSAVMAQDGYIYLKPDGGWSDAGARFAAYFFGETGTQWVELKAVQGAENYYGCMKPGTHTSVIFCRYDPNTTGTGWDNWGKTGELALNAQNNLFTTTGWENDLGVGNWSSITEF